MRGSSIVDAMFAEAPSSTKNAERARDLEVHLVKKGNAWHFDHGAGAREGPGAGRVGHRHPEKPGEPPGRLSANLSSFPL